MKVNVNYNLQFDFKNQTPADFFILVNRLIKNRRFDQANALLQLGKKMYGSTAQIHYLFSKTFEKRNPKQHLFHLKRCIEKNKRYTDALIDLAFIDPSTCEDLLHAAHIHRSFGNIEKSNHLYKENLEIQLHHNIVNKTTLIQNLIIEHGYTRYAEIGAFVGMNIFQIKVDYTWAIDNPLRVPHWHDNKEDYITYIESSGLAFLEKADQDNLQLDIILIDNQTSYKCSKSLVEKSISLIQDNGVIMLTNCIPPDEVAASKSLIDAYQSSKYNGVWIGDVYKTILWLKSHMDNVTIDMYPSDRGLAVIRKGTNNELLKLSDAEIENYDYDKLCINLNDIFKVMKNQN